MLLCKHAYHQKCIDPWLTKNRKVCPICKRRVGPSNGSDSDSDTERNTVNSLVPSTSRDVDPLITNVYDNPNQTSNSRPSILNLWWHSRNRNNDNTSELPSTEPLPNFTADAGTSNDENRRPVTERVGNAFNRAISSLKRKFTRADPNTHQRLENDDTISAVLDSDVVNLIRSVNLSHFQVENPNRFVADNAAYANSPDGASLTTVHSNQYCVQAEVEPIPSNENQE